MSKRPSGAKSERSTRPRDAVTFFVDRCLGCYDVPNALRESGLIVEVHKEHFDSDCEDSVWIAEVGRRGWIMLTKDKSFRTRRIEIAALMRANTATFVLTNSNATGRQHAAVFIRALPRIMKLVRDFTRPFLARITPAGSVNIVLTHQNMIDLHARLPPE